MKQETLKSKKGISSLYLIPVIIIAAGINIYLQLYVEELLLQPAIAIAGLLLIYVLVRNKGWKIELNKAITTYTLITILIAGLDLYTTHKIISVYGVEHEASNVMRLLLNYLPWSITYSFYMIFNTLLIFLLIQILNKYKHVHHTTAPLAIYSLVVINNLIVMMKI